MFFNVIAMGHHRPPGSPSVTKPFLYYLSTGIWRFYTLHTVLYGKDLSWLAIK